VTHFEAVQPVLLPTWRHRSSRLPTAIEFNADCVAFLLQRRESIGVVASGLFESFSILADRGDALQIDDIRLAEVCALRFRHVSTFVKPAAGIGAFVCLVASLGLPIYGIENDRRRFNCMVALKQQLSQKYSSVRRATPVLGSLTCQISDVELGAAVAITNGFTATPSDEVALIKSFGQYGHVIVDLSRFAQPRRTDDERRRLIASICAEGFAPPELLGPAEDWRGSHYAVFKKRA
jgi:hypothetical protein